MAGAIRAGNIGFVTKQSRADDVTDAVRRAAAGEAVMAPEILERMLPRLAEGPRSPVFTATPRERERLELLAGGASDVEIAERRYLSTNTVRNHLSQIHRRLGAKSRLEALAIAVREGLIERR